MDILHTYLYCYNEEKLLPYVLNHYNTISDLIYVYDNGSTDSSDEIYKRYDKIKVIKYFTDTFDELDFVKRKSNDYKQSRGVANWVAICDVDEIIDHPQLKNFLNKYTENNITMADLNAQWLVGTDWGNPEKDTIFQIMKFRSCKEPHNGKAQLISPNIDIEYGPGCHTFKCNKYLKSKKEIYTFHCQMYDSDYIFKRNQTFAKRKSERTKKFGYDFHWGWNKDQLLLPIKNIVDKGILFNSTDIK
jgi:hypothetical protein